LFVGIYGTCFGFYVTAAKLAVICRRVPSRRPFLHPPNFPPAFPAPSIFPSEIVFVVAIMGRCFFSVVGRGLSDVSGRSRAQKEKKEMSFAKVFSFRLEYVLVYY